MASSSTRLTAALQPGGILTLEREPAPAGFRPTADVQALEKDLEGAFAGDHALFLLRLALSDPALPLHPTLRFWRDFSAAFPRRLLLLPEVESLRAEAEAPLEDHALRALLEAAPPMAGAEYLGPSALRYYWAGLHRLYRERIGAFSGSVEDWFNSLPGSTREIGRIHFHLVENRQGPLPFAFMATYGSHVGSQGRVRHLPLRHALEEFQGDARRQIEVLKSIHRAAGGSPWLRKLVDSGEVFHPLGWTPTQAHRFLRDVPVFSDAGILCRIPDWWRAARKGVQLRIGLGEKAKEGLGMETLLDFHPELTLDGVPLEEAELRRLAETGEELALLKGKWVAVDAAKVKRSMDLFQRARKLAKGKQITLAEALRMLAGTDRETPLGLDTDEAEIVQGQWLRDLMEKMRNPALVRGIRPGPAFRGDLRPYQQLGLNWLAFLHALGFGGCLADDMGLGKTVQVLALLQALKDMGSKRASRSGSLGVLLVAPASLLRNWTAEIARFTPELQVAVAHPAWEEKPGKTPAGKSASGSGVRAESSESEPDVVITTYGMVDRLAWVKEKAWTQVILDEGQAIKNPGSRQSRAVKALKSSHRLVLTGTPIENRLSDLWSLFDFLNPGLLGSAEEFRKRANRLQDEPETYGRLRQVVQPYILRRLKTDKALLPDLPDKVERKVYAGLSRKQAVLYRGLVGKLEDSLEGASGIKRRGRILALLMQFKQICNHPDHFTGTGRYREEDSGKFGLLREICEPIVEKHERVLVFTQFAEIADPLAGFLAEVFGRPGLLLTGGTAVGRRHSLVEAFQGDDYVPFMVLSLKAGGTGLNLTRANHVVHFDRWWNPAVENQATDRAFRIGQTKNVMVHKFVTRGTLEEKIDALIESKASLARDILPAGNEDWITEMSDEQIVDMFTLDAREAQ